MNQDDFPDGFLWGAATSSHQVEGGTRNQWSEWERSPERLARLEREGLIARYGRENFISGAAADHYHRFESDFALAKELGHNATRISIEWSRVESREGEFNAVEVDHYRQVIASIRRNGMVPFVTLWHWTFPLWFRDRGGFGRRGNVRYFARFAARMAAEFPDVPFWLTINEPEVYTNTSYLRGDWPPQARNPILAIRVFHNLIAAHKAAYREIKTASPSSRVGIAKNNTYFEAYGGAVGNRIVKRFLDWTVNHYFLDHIRDAQDFIGLNHYFHSRIRRGVSNRNENTTVSDLGWELFPAAMCETIMDLRRYGVPIYITENGLADARDERRSWFIAETLANVRRAIADGADVRGYLHWSLMDNFEWANGFWPRFGLIEIDYRTFARKIRPSALAYRDIIQESRKSVS